MNSFKTAVPVQMEHICMSQQQITHKKSRAEQRVYQDFWGEGGHNTLLLLKRTEFLAQFISKDQTYTVYSLTFRNECCLIRCSCFLSSTSCFQGYKFRVISLKLSPIVCFSFLVYFFFTQPWKKMSNYPCLWKRGDISDTQSIMEHYGAVPLHIPGQRFRSFQPYKVQLFSSPSVLKNIYYVQYCYKTQ